MYFFCIFVFLHARAQCKRLRVKEIIATPSTFQFPGMSNFFGAHAEGFNRLTAFATGQEMSHCETFTISSEWLVFFKLSFCGRLEMARMSDWF